MKSKRFFSVNDELVKVKLIKQANHLMLQMRDLCPEGIDRCHCLYDNGTYVKGPFYYEEDPLNTALLYQTCNPDFCYCKNSPDVERDSRNVEMKAIMDLCPRNEMHRCLCEDNSVVKFPFDMTTLFQTCRPKRVRDNKPKGGRRQNLLFFEALWQNSSCKSERFCLRVSYIHLHSRQRFEKQAMISRLPD